MKMKLRLKKPLRNRLAKRFRSKSDGLDGFIKSVGEILGEEEAEQIRIELDTLKREIRLLKRVKNCQKKR